MTRGVALLLTVLTGFTGLVYEVTWQKCLATLLGSHSEATAAVLGIFLGGLSVGYALFGRVVAAQLARAEARGEPPRLLLLYGGVEAAIGVWALCFPALFAGVQQLSLAVALDSELAAFALDVGLTVLLIGPPTVLMGGTIPILTQALSKSLDDATRLHAFVYGFNTVGAFGGALAAGFTLIPLLGIRATLAWMGGINLLVGAAFALLSHRERGTAPLAVATSPAGAPAGFALYSGAALLIGFSMMTVQTVLIRVGGLALGASHFTFAMVVAVFVLCIALGSLAVSLAPSIPRAAVVAAPALLTLLLALLHRVLPDAPYWAHVLRTVFSDAPAAFHPYYLAAFAALLAVLFVPVGLSGASLPLLFHHLRREVGELGSVAGRLYAWNTVGSLLGALVGGYALYFWLDLHHVYRVGVGAAALAALLLAVRVLALPLAAAALAVGPLAYALMALPDWPPERLSAGLFRSRTPIDGSYAGPDAFFRSHWQRHYVFYTDDPTSSVAVRERTFAGRQDRSIITNGKSDGSIVADYTTMALAGLLPCVLGASCEQGFVIGWGTGVTVGELAALRSMQRVDVAEISSGVLETAELFDFGNRNASHNPAVRVIRSDAYRALLRSDTRYDVIASEPSNPWVTGVENLFSREFLEAARDRLTPGGVYAQWFHIYETDEATISLVLRTYREVFDEVAVWYAIGHDLLLLGFAGAPDLSLERLAERVAQPDLAAGLARAGVRSLPALLAHELLPLGVAEHTRLGDEVHTLLHPLLSDRAARAFFSGRNGTLPFTGAPEAARRGAEASLLRRWAEDGVSGDPDGMRAAASELCLYRPHECAAFLAWWRHRDPGSEARADLRQRRERLFAEHLDAARIAELAELFRRGAPNRTTLEEARHATRLFEDYYFHAAPFSRAALDATWAHCRDPKCAAERSEAEQRLGSFSDRVVAAE